MSKDLSTRYLGITLKNPLVVSACPITAELDTLQRMQDFGAAAAVMPSLFEEQIEEPATNITRAPQLGYDADRESTQIYRRLDAYNRGPELYLKRLSQAKRAVEIPLIGSLNGLTNSGWIDYARRIEEAGADALELNMYYIAADVTTSSAELETRYVDCVAAVCDTVTIPVSVKLSPFFTALASMAQQFADVGAEGLVLFNRFLQPDIDVASGQVMARFRFSNSSDLQLPLRWIAILKGRVPVSLAATGGIHAAEDLVKVLLAGADAAMVASVLYRNGVDTLRDLLNGLTNWVERSDFDSVEHFKGALSQRYCENPAEFERANYAKVIAESNQGTV